jgi:hypothetical protein
MPSLLQTRLAMTVLLGIFLIPVGLTSMRGLTHILTCSSQVEQPFEVRFDPSLGAVLTGSTQVRPDQEPLCGALLADIAVQSGDHNQIDLTIPITNGSAIPWRGTVQLRVGATQVPVAIGLVPPGETRTETIRLRLPDGVTTVDGSILVGP